jgi:hypothetical protein
MSTIADIIEESNTRIRAIEDMMAIIEELRADIAELKADVKEIVRTTIDTPEGTVD